jgi:hypothetical protein
MLQQFAYWFERISLAKVLAQHPVIFVPLLILFFAGVVTYIVSGQRTRDFLGKFARGLLIVYLAYNLLVAVGIAVFLTYQNYA